MAQFSMKGKMPAALVEEFLKAIGEFQEKHRQDVLLVFAFDCPELSLKEKELIMGRAGLKHQSFPQPSKQGDKPV